MKTEILKSAIDTATVKMEACKAAGNETAAKIYRHNLGRIELALEAIEDFKTALSNDAENAIHWRTSDLMRHTAKAEASALVISILSKFEPEQVIAEGTVRAKRHLANAAKRMMYELSSTNQVANLQNQISMQVFFESADDLEGDFM